MDEPIDSESIASVLSVPGSKQGSHFLDDPNDCPHQDSAKTRLRPAVGEDESCRGRSPRSFPHPVGGVFAGAGRIGTVRSPLRHQGFGKVGWPPLVRRHTDMFSGTRTGSDEVIPAPPARSGILAAPPCARATASTKASPRPCPGELLRLTNRLKIRLPMSGGNPGPLSSNTRSAAPGAKGVEY